jgi:large subunit ribosomal protein L16
VGLSKIKFMLLNPRNFKYKKQQKGKALNKIQGSSASGLTQLKFGSVGLKALTPGRLTAKQINAVRQCIHKRMKKLGRLKVNIFPHTPISKKPIEVRMGKGKGNVDHYVFKVNSGVILYEVETSFISVAIKALKSGQIRLPLKTTIIFN